jgi:ATP-dependent exoDNAse (exonuclease V) beta subunit
LKKAVRVESELSDADEGDCVKVMTAHAAKGLEFPVTIIAAMDKGTQRDTSPVTFTPAIGLGLKWSHPSEKDGIEDSWQRANRAELRRREKEESNRLLYVAMTRAEEHLILSYAHSPNRPSPWEKLVDTVLAPPTIDFDPPPPAASVTEPEGEEVLVIPKPQV